MFYQEPPPNTQNEQENLNNLRRERQQTWEQERNLREDLGKEFAKRNISITVDKGEINYQNKGSDIKHGANEKIEIKPQIDEHGNLNWFVMNKTISETPQRNLPQGELYFATPDDLITLRDQIKPDNPQTANRINKYIQDYQNGNGYKKAYIFRENGKATGWTYLGETGTGAHITWIQTFPREESRGVSSAIISKLKEKYDHLNLNPVSKHDTLDPHEAQMRLMKFYKSNGFVAGNEWQSPPSYISLDDIQNAREYQTVEIIVGVDNNKISDADIAKVFLTKANQVSNIKAELPLNIQSQLDLWLKTEQKSLELDRRISL